MSFQCDLESMSNKYTVFITLTYANRYIPRAQFVDSLDRPFDADLVDKETGELFGAVGMNEECRAALLGKFYLFGDVPYLRKSDLQKFFKRFRYYAKKYTKEKVRYFAVGEYGPVHFRPHYHILLYFNSEELLQVCSDCVSASWSLGRVDCQLSKGQCSSYVASYVNSTCTLPKVFTLAPVRPFCVHSQKLGQSILQSERSQIYEMPVDDFIKRSVVCNGVYREFNLWRSYYSYYFPKCRDYANLSSLQRAYVYGLYDEARLCFPQCETASALAKEIAACIRYFGCDEKTFCLDMFGYQSDSARLFRLLHYFDDPQCNNYPVESDVFQHWVNRIYTELLLSKHFLTFVCDFRTLSERTRKLRIIDSFYKRLDYLHLVQFFENQSLFYESDLVGSTDLLSDEWENTYCPYFYDNVDYTMSRYKMSTPYRLYSAEVDERFRQKIKHKTLNDQNKIFLD